jgi:aspartate racemase
MDTATMNKALGIVGGMGPFASADFVLSIYENNVGGSEQEAPALVLYSDPRLPDRTAAFLRGSEDLLLELLENAMWRLHDCQVSRLVVACVTIHHLLRRVSPRLREMTIPLTDVVLDAVVFTQKPTLLLATEGTRKMRVFESSEHWPEAASYLMWPTDTDQRTLQRLIYSELKANGNPGNVVGFLAELCHRYAVDQVVAGCTELHRLSRYLLTAERSRMPANIIDPLMIIAQQYRALIHEQVEPYGRLCKASSACR